MNSASPTPARTNHGRQATPQPPGAPADANVAFHVHSLDARSLPDDAVKSRWTKSEWLLTNGIGGYAMGTASGIPTRRYHGMLIAATKPPVGRMMTLSHTIDTLVIDPASASGPARQVPLSSLAFAGPPLQPPVIHPRGIDALVRFEKGLSCRWSYEPDTGAQRVSITKELFLHERKNTASLRYRIQRGSADVSLGLRLHIRPMLAMRDVHALASKAWAGGYVADTGGSSVRVSREGLHVHLVSDSASFASDAAWWERIFYAIEQDRGQDCLEDAYSPGYFLLDLPAGESSAECVIQASLIATPGIEHEMLELDPSIALKRDRLARMVRLTMAERQVTSQDADVITDLVQASDDFVVLRHDRIHPSSGWGVGADPAACASLTETSVIAGYPWFSDWGRDTFISLPGLMLATGRADDARRTLLSFARAQQAGLIPNVFSDQTGEPEFNTVDGSLWFIHAACAYLSRTGDRAIFDTDLLPACLAVVAAYRRGTHFSIAMDPYDKLITAGTPGTQLTWMDAKRDGVVFTPRWGKPVEINALWYSALRLLSQAIGPRDPSAAANLNALGDAVAKSFRAAFFPSPRGCLYDVLSPSDHGGWNPVDLGRPNQIFAVSLPHSPLSADEQAAVVKYVRDTLVTPVGVRTLDPADLGYQARYIGDMMNRDRAYHNGTVWPWLLGPYAEAVLRVGRFSPAAKLEARTVLAPLIAELRAARTNGGCLGQLAEVYDADAPRSPQGCTAQAWSVAETLRVWLLTMDSGA